MSVGEAHVGPLPQWDGQVTRLLVTEKDELGLYRPVGFLDAVDCGEEVAYRFAYLEAATRRPSFRPLLGFRDATRPYESAGLFPLFAERIMDPRRPDRPMYLAALDLEDEATPLEVLARSGGQRAGDGILLTPVPHVDGNGRTSCVFLVHGIRHLLGATERVDSLRPGDRLRITPEPANPVNPRALLVTEDGNRPLGWVPDALLDYVHEVQDGTLTVVRVNPREVGTRLRLLVRLEGVASPDWQPFTGPNWSTVG
ncbi:hypothetical protein [Blastococcus goldschmidtiae]|uniref:HIRAN domain-containing protein n=1 Tax=Blastococcus goldschmidtiae TaxID=3075546 RepID=A0ABU2K7P0_9ACTN|nr:hypothetical protein [Blastococcus sp. DSM 46792]MDT0276209.1 hypothetical protein [Blastococcus sp. DSM 46792]